MRSTSVAAVVSIVLLLAWAGCNRHQGPARHDLSGSVTYGGKPLSVGFMKFTPDGAKGNGGPGTAAGVTPGRRLAWPMVAGRTRSSVSRISRESPLMAP